MIENETAESPRALLARLKWFIGLIFIGGLVGTLIIVAFFWRAWHRPSVQLPTQVVSKIDAFKPYYFTSEIPGGFELKQGSVVFDKNVLLFQISDSAQNRNIAVTEQVLPPSIASQAYPSAEKVPGTDGEGLITYDGTKTIAVLFSPRHSNAQTLILMTTTDPVPKDTIGDILRALRPVN